MMGQEDCCEVYFPVALGPDGGMFGGEVHGELSDCQTHTELCCIVQWWS